MVEHIVSRRHWAVWLTLAVSCLQVCTPVFKDYPGITAVLTAAASLTYLIARWIEKS